MSYIYLASPYSDPDPQIMENRYLLAESYTAFVLKKRIPIYSPIVHCHTLAKKYSLPTDSKWWQEYNRAMIHHAHSLYILTIPGWGESEGIKFEHKEATEHNITVLHVSLPWVELLSPTKKIED